MNSGDMILVRCDNTHLKKKRKFIAMWGSQFICETPNGKTVSVWQYGEEIN